MKKYIATLEFKTGEYGNIFYKVIEESSLPAAEIKLKEYFRDFYGENGLDEEKGWKFEYLGGDVVVSIEMLEECTDAEIISRLTI